MATDAKTLAAALYGPGTVNAGPPDEAQSKPAPYVTAQERQFGELGRLMYGPGTLAGVGPDSEAAQPSASDSAEAASVLEVLTAPDMAKSPKVVAVLARVGRELKKAKSR